jgi:phosphotriesterase-related protein
MSRQRQGDAATTVETARGPVSTDALGSVLMHEHVFILSHEFHVNDPEVVGFDEDREFSAAVTRMNELVDAGVGTIVDLTVVGLGRDIRLLARSPSRPR